MCHVFTSRRAFALLQPGADSLVYSTIGLRSVLHCSCWSIWFVSGHARGVLPTLSGSCDPFAGSSRHAEPFLLSFTVITAASVTSPSLSLSHSCFLLMSIPLNIVITHLETHRGQKKGYTLAGKQLLTLERNLCVFNTHTHTSSSDSSSSSSSLSSDSLSGSSLRSGLVSEYSSFLMSSLSRP